MKPFQLVRIDEAGKVHYTGICVYAKDLEHARIVCQTDYPKENFSVWG